MRFWKYQGLGNDFIIVRADPSRVDPRAVVAMCDRHFGVGADGVLAVSPAPGAAGRMSVFNADGSRPEMCGNGVRCVARFLADTAPEMLADAFVVHTDAGPMHVKLQGAQIAVRLARPTLRGELTVDLGSGPRAGLHMDSGNPHLVLFDPGPALDYARLGARLQPVAPEGVNVSFATVVDPARVDLVVFERGCGLTLACGTAACATVTAGWIAGLLDPNRPVVVRLPGGELEVSAQGDAAIMMTGPAALSFVGEWSGPLLGP